MSDSMDSLEGSSISTSFLEYSCNEGFKVEDILDILNRLEERDDISKYFVRVVADEDLEFEGIRPLKRFRLVKQ